MDRRRFLTLKEKNKPVANGNSSRVCQDSDKEEIIDHFSVAGENHEKVNNINKVWGVFFNLKNTDFRVSTTSEVKWHLSLHKMDQFLHLHKKLHDAYYY